MGYYTDGCEYGTCSHRGEFPGAGRYRLTAFQLEEVRGLLAVCQDEERLSGERRPWGRLEGARLWVTDPVDAADDLWRRAEYLLDEGYRVKRAPVGLAGSRSLRGWPPRSWRPIGGRALYRGS